MTLLYIDGMDSYISQSDILAAGWQRTGSGIETINKSNGRFGKGAINVGYSNQASRLRCPLPASISAGSVYIGASMKIAEQRSPGSAGYGHLLGPGNASGSFPRVGINAALTQFQLRDSASGSATINFSPNLGIYYRVELRIDIGTGASDGFMELKVNGVTIGSLSSCDTRFPAAAGYIIFGGGGGTDGADGGLAPDTYWDDLTVSDSGYVNDVRIDSLLTTANGSPMNWTPSTGNAWACIDDNLNSASMSDYIYSSTPSQKAEFALSDLVGASSAIYGVNVRAFGLNSDAGARTTNAYLNSGGSVSNFPAVSFSTTASWAIGKNAPVELNPNGSVAWNDTSINALVLGFNVAS